MKLPMPIFIVTQPKLSPLDRVLQFLEKPINRTTLCQIENLRTELRREAYAAGGRTPEQQHAIALLAELRKSCVTEMGRP